MTADESQTKRFRLQKVLEAAKDSPCFRRSKFAPLRRSDFDPCLKQASCLESLPSNPRFDVMIVLIVSYR